MRELGVGPDQLFPGVVELLGGLRQFELQVVRRMLLHGDVFWLAREVIDLLLKLFNLMILVCEERLDVFLLTIYLLALNLDLHLLIINRLELLAQQLRVLECNKLSVCFIDLILGINLLLYSAAEAVVHHSHACVLIDPLLKNPVDVLALRLELAR
jgi:hypothetical protein